ncbi:MAG: hypothetical protein MOGMAGMI_00722 [Candidatus Omnitrophica bacterium]|nr:hypothetical protein [Candidatus Omnitrophota bacterium]
MSKTKAKILVIASDANLRRTLGGAGRNLCWADPPDIEGLVRCVFDEVPNLIVIDEGYGGSGLDAAIRLKQDVVLKYIPVALLVQDPPREPDRDVDAYALKSASSEEVLSQLSALVETNWHELDLNPLTSLPGTRSSVMRIEDALESRRKFAVCCVDLSNLSAFNTVYGDHRGDGVIIALGRILREALLKHGGGADFIGHLGGDDFIIVTEPERAVSVAESLIEEFDATIGSFYDPPDRDRGYILCRRPDGRSTRYPVMSVSVAVVHNDDGQLHEMAEVSRIAGELKRYMSSLPGSCYIKYGLVEEQRPGSPASTLEVSFPSKLKSLSHGRIAGSEAPKYAAFHRLILKARQIRTVYQPIVDLKKRSIVGYEALTRALSNYPADEATSLFSDARTFGRVKELDRICVEYALKNGQDLHPEHKIFININHETLIDDAFFHDLFSCRGRLPFRNIVIEVTEQSLLRSFDKVREALAGLKEQGVSVAIDDVGGGAVSLRDVAVLKPDFIKFDRSLIRQIDLNPTKQQIVQSMILFARAINARTTAEGIETPDECQAVIECGVDLGQGYYFAKPGSPFPTLAIS